MPPQKLPPQPKNLPETQPQERLVKGLRLRLSLRGRLLRPLRPRLRLLLRLQ